MFQYHIIRAIFLSFIVAVGHVSGASSSGVQNLGPHGLGDLGNRQIIFSSNSLLGRMSSATVNRTISHLAEWISPTYGTEFLGTRRTTVVGKTVIALKQRERTVNNFLNILQRDTAGQYPLPSNFWRNFVRAGGISAALLFGIYNMPYIKDIDARKKAYIAGLAAVVGLGFACKGLYRLYVPSTQTEDNITTEVVRQHNRFFDDKKLLFEFVMNELLKEPVQGNNAHTYLQLLGEIKTHVDIALNLQKIGTMATDKPHPDILQEVRAAYLQAQVPAHRAYIAGGLVSGLSSLYAVHQLGGFNRVAA